MGCVYLITNTVTGMKYVGKTIQDVRKRWRSHVSDAKKGAERPLQRAIRKYGDEAFTVEILEESTDESDLLDFEIGAILVLGTKAPNGYNLTDGGDGTSGYSRSDESREKDRLNALGKRKYSKLTDEQVVRIRERYRSTQITQMDLSREYQVSERTIARVVRYETYLESK